MPLQFILNSKAMRRINLLATRSSPGCRSARMSRMNQVRPAKRRHLLDMVEEYIETMSRLTSGLQTT